MITLTDSSLKFLQASENSTYSKLLAVISFHSGKNILTADFFKCVEKAKKGKKLYRVFKYDYTNVDYGGRDEQPCWRQSYHY